MAIYKMHKEGYAVRTETEFEVDLKAKDDCIRVQFEDGHGAANFVIDMAPNEASTVKSRAELDAIHKMLDAAWEHWVKVEKRGKA